MKTLKYTLWVVATLVSCGYAQMKCESGKCAFTKSVRFKTSPSKSDIATKTFTTGSVLPTQTEKRKPSRPTVKQLFNVTTTRVVKKSVAPKQINYGYIVADESEKTEVVTRYDGYVVTLYADTRYRKVKKGEKLATVYAPEVYKAKQDYLNALNFDAKRPSAAMVRSSRAKLELLGVAAKEIEAIKPGGGVGTYTTVYAPRDGWIFDKRIEAGSAFKKGTRLFEIVSLDSVWMEAKLYQEQIAKLKHLVRFTVVPEGFDKEFEAKKELLYPALDPKEAVATLRLSIRNENETLLPGMYAKLYAYAEAKTRLLLPATALIRKNGAWYVFLATAFEGEYEPIEVKVKALDNRYYEVLEGLKEGEEVVNDALFLMDADAQIGGLIR